MKRDLDSAEEILRETKEAIAEMSSEEGVLVLNFAILAVLLDIRDILNN